MASKGRVRLHQIRKKIVGRLERLWPSRPLAEVATTLHEAHRTFIAAPEAKPDLPAHALKVYRDYAAMDDVDAVRRVDMPATVDPTMGLIFVEGKIVWGSTDQPWRERGARFARHLVTPERRMPRAILLHHAHGNNYFHFFDLVTAKAHRAELAGLAPDIPFLVPALTAQTSFFKEAVALGVFGTREVVVQGRGEVIGVDEAWLIRSYDCTREAFDWAADRLLAGALPQGTAERQDAPVMIVRGSRALNARYYRNQDELNEIARARGVEIYDPAEHPLKDQIARFSRASAIIGAHGAGLTNMMFRKEKCAILEIFNPDHATPHYYLMARQRGFDYRWMMARDPVGKSSVSSTYVPPDEFAAALDALLG